MTRLSRMITFALAGAALYAPGASAATCAFQEQLKDVSDAMMQCLEQIQSSGYDLPNADPAAKKKLAQAIADGVHVLDQQEKWLNQQKISPDPGDVLKNNKLQIADIRDLTKDETAQAAQIVSQNSGADSKDSPAGPAATPSGPPGGTGGYPGGASTTGSAAGDAGEGGGAPGVAGGSGSAPTGSTGAGSSGGGPRGSGSNGAGGTRSGDVNSATPGSMGNAGGVGKLGGQLKSDLDSSAKIAAGDFSGNGAPGSKMGSFGPGGRAGQVLPTSDASLALAAGPHSQAFEKNGLRVAAGPDGRPAIVDNAGRPASEAQRRILLADIRAEPAAVERDPFFFTPSKGGIAREDFNSLKETFHNDAKARETDFKHIVLSPLGEERDFTRSQACELVSGECNPHAKKSYAKGDTVPAADLRSIVASLRERLLGAADRRGVLQRPAHRLSGAGGRLGGILSSLSSWLGGGGTSAAGAVQESAAAPSGASLGGAAMTAGDAPRPASQTGGGATSAARPTLASVSDLPARLTLLALGLLGTGLMAGAAYVLFKRDTKSWNR